MNMSRLVADAKLLTLCCFTLVCVYGKSQDLFPCEVDVMVWRGTTRNTVPQRPLTVRCPVKHCGESLNVTWCKLLDKNNCEPINYTENVEIRQTDERAQDELISYLTFTRISIGDNGLYRCTLKGHKYQLISHIINISVSDLNQGVTIPDYNADAAGDEEVPWLPSSSLCVGVALLAVTLTAAALLSCYGWKRQLNPTQGQEVGQERSTDMIPDIPNASAPSLFMYYSPSTAEASQPPPTADGNKPAVANSAEGSQVSDRVVYAAVNHRQTGTPVRG